jgi:O-antigen ligase
MTQLRMNKPRLLVPAFALYAVLSLISMAAMSIGAGLLLLCLLIDAGGPLELCRQLFSRVRAQTSVRRFAWLSGFFVIACLLSLIVAKIWPTSVAGKTSDVHLLKDSAKLWYFAWPFILWTGLLSCSPADRKSILRNWISAFVVLSVLGIAQYFTGWPRPRFIPTDPEHFHVTLFLGHHLSVASILIFPFFALLDCGWAMTGWGKIWRYVAITLGFVALMLTYSRTLWVALPIGMVLWFALHVGRFGKKALFATVLVALVGGALLFQLPSVHERIMVPGAIRERADLWEANLSFFKSRPWTGVGLKHNEELSGYYLMDKYKTDSVFQGHAHNNFLDVLSSLGIVGAGAFLAWWIFLISLVVRGRSRDDGFFAKGLLAAFLVYHVNGLTQVNFWEAKVQHQLMWVVAWVLVWSTEKNGTALE